MALDLRGHARWIPLDLSLGPDGLEESLTARFSGSMPEADLGLVVSGLVGIVRTIVERSAEAHVTPLASWALTSAPARLEPAAVATLARAGVDPGATVDDCVRDLVGGQPLYTAPSVEPVDTDSGEALLVRFRPMLTDEGTTEVHESISVLWPRLEHGHLLLLSTYLTDLVEAPEVAGLLADLARGLQGA